MTDQPTPTYVPSPEPLLLPYVFGEKVMDWLARTLMRDATTEILAVKLECGGGTLEGPDDIGGCVTPLINAARHLFEGRIEFVPKYRQPTGFNDVVVCDVDDHDPEAIQKWSSVFHVILRANTCRTWSGSPEAFIDSGAEERDWPEGFTSDDFLDRLEVQDDRLADYLATIHARSTGRWVFNSRDL